MIHKLAEDCFSCGLRQGCKQVVWGDGPEDLSEVNWMFIAEGPGPVEDEQGKPLVGKTGQEFDWLLARHGIRRSKVYVSNVVKCRPPNNRDPKPEEIKSCRDWLDEEIGIVKPKLIVAVGRFATRHFLPDANMEMVHGIPFQMEGFVLIPTYHVAAGLHDPNRMMAIHADFQAVRDVIAWERPPRHLEDPLKGQEVYEYITTNGLKYLINTRERDIISIDTEWGEDEPLCATISFFPGQGFRIDLEDEATLAVLNNFVADPSITTVLHNALYDLPVLKLMGVNPAKVADTMEMAYLLQGEPQGLKPLAYRHFGMEMFSYKEVVREATRLKALRYLASAVEYSWPDSEPVLEWPKGKPHIRQPQNVGKKIARILLDSTLGDADPYDRWQKIKEGEGREFVEKCLGRMAIGNLSDIDPQQATYYACRDADATIRLYDILWPRILNDGLEQTFWIDMNAMPMAQDMMESGILADVPYFKGLTDYFQEKLDSLESQITRISGQAINPGAHEQVADLLFNHLKLKPIKKTKGGKNSTEEGVLSRLVDKHPVVQLIRDHRETAKLKGTYTEAIPRFAREDDRVHGNIRLTRTATGRLSMADPNLQNQPIRSEEGRKIRKGFIASDGCSLVSSDYSQIELRMMAHMSQDRRMIDIFMRGEDIHAKTASDMFGVPMEQLDKMKHRYPAKRTNFGIAYGITDQGLYRDFVTAGAEGWTVNKCQDLINEWLFIYKDYAKYLRSVHTHARRYGFVVDWVGRRRYVPAVRCRSRYLVEEALRMAGNHPIQAGAQEVIKTAMGDLVPWVKKFRGDGNTANPLLQIHDDLLFEIADDFLGTAIPVIQGVMENAVTLSIPTPVDPEVGKNWAEMKKWRKAA